MHRAARGAHQVWRREIDGVEFALWTAQRAGGGVYAALFNLGETDGKVSVGLDELDILAGGTATELWSGKAKAVQGKLTAKVPPHGAKVWLIQEDRP